LGLNGKIGKSIIARQGFQLDLATVSGLGFGHPDESFRCARNFLV
jgi:hypothetical protein